MNVAPTPEDLARRIATAFEPAATSDGIPDLLAQAEAAAVLYGEAAERARARALDPALAREDVAQARAEMEDAAFRRDRLLTAVKRLGERLNDLRAREEDQRRRIAYEKLRAERDQLAAELAEVYPPIEKRLADLLARIAENDRQVERINTRDRPVGAEWLHPAEAVARGLSRFTANGGITNIPRLTTDLRLPAFRFSGAKPYAWPPSG